MWNVWVETYWGSLISMVFEPPRDVRGGMIESPRETRTALSYDNPPQIELTVWLQIPHEVTL